jgi:biotin carboxyl carrier protein
MTFEVDIDGRTRVVAVERTNGGRFRVLLDGTAHEVDAARVGVYGLSLLIDVERGGGGGRLQPARSEGVSREVQVTPASTRGDLLVTFGGRVLKGTIDGRRSRRAGDDAGGSAAGEQAILAPMPGRVVRVLVSEGQDVEARQGVVVVEAMKMENELRSPKKGRVKSVGVAAGASVEAGRVLMVVE